MLNRYALTKTNVSNRSLLKVHVLNFQIKHTKNLKLLTDWTFFAFFEAFFIKRKDYEATKLKIAEV
jgi:hypothetical protein